MNVKQFLDQVAYTVEKEYAGEMMTEYRSNYDDSYITFVGQEKNIMFLAKLEITDQLTHGVGFSPKDSKWYGWSHRAIYGFKIGSTCKKGDCHYIASSDADLLEAALEFWRCDDYADVRSDGIIENDDGDKFYDIKWDYLPSTPNKSLHGTIGGVEHYIKTLGRGEWVAKTMDDAKQMAEDFSAGVS